MYAYRILHFDETECHEDNIDVIGRQVERHFFSQQEQKQYWISLSLDSLDKNEWNPMGQYANDMEGSYGDDDKLSVDFVESFLE